MIWIKKSDLAVTIIVLLTFGTTINLNAKPRTNGGSKENTNVRKVLEHRPLPNNSTIVGALRGVFQATELSGWSAVELQGVLGHAFNFIMWSGAKETWQVDYLDYHDGFFDMLPDVARFRVYQAYQAEEKGDFVALKADTWKAVRESIDRGIPAIAWQPMSPEQRDAGIGGGAWGMLVGYDLTNETYTVRHQYYKRGKEAYEVRHDEIGHTDPSEWFCVLVYEGPAEVDSKELHLRALGNAVAFAEGTRYEDEHYLESGGRGDGAYTRWIEALEHEGIVARHSKGHAWELTDFRGHAAVYLRGLVDIFPKAAPQLKAAAAHYDREVDIARRLEAFCGAAHESGGFTAQARVEARAMVREASEADQAAISKIKECLDVLATRGSPKQGVKGISK